jgi:hypothetical protein
MAVIMDKIVASVGWVYSSINLNGQLGTGVLVGGGTLVGGGGGAGVPVAVGVGVRVGRGVRVGVGVEVAVGIEVRVGVGVMVGVGVATGVEVKVGWSVFTISDVGSTSTAIASNLSNGEARVQAVVSARATSTPNIQILLL